MNIRNSFYWYIFLLLSFLILIPAASDVSAQGTIEPTPFIYLEYNYDAAGNVKSIINHIDPSMSATMSYDKLGRLTKTSGPWGNGRYTYDAVGNRTSKNINNEYVSYGYTSPNNYLDDVVHDSSGNIVEDSNHRYVYDSEDRLIEVWSGDKRIAAYNYDAFGRRISKTDEKGNTTYFAYGTGQKILTEFNGNGVPRFDYIYAGSRKIARVDHSDEQYEGRVTFYHANHLGSNIALTDNYTSLVWDKEYLPFGGDYSDLNGNTVDNYHQYTSQELDKETGLYYFGARYYNPEIGRFMSVDPAGIDVTNPQSWNRYSYVQNNPYKYVDPDGRQLVDVKGNVELNIKVRSYLDFIPEFLLDAFIPTEPKGIVESSIIGPQALGGVVINGSKNVLAKPDYFANAGGFIRSFVTNKDEVYYRVFSGNKTGKFLTKVKPKNKNYVIEGLALPRENSADYIQEVIVPAGTMLQRSRILPAFGKRGGLEQFELLHRIPEENFGKGIPFE